MTTRSASGKASGNITNTPGSGSVKSLFSSIKNKTKQKQMASWEEIIDDNDTLGLPENFAQMNIDGSYDGGYD